jgi:hypothetical protein
MNSENGEIGQLRTTISDLTSYLTTLKTAVEKVVKTETQEGINSYDIELTYDKNRLSGINLTKKTEKAASMDTGGYTGAWGSEGKWLLAHEKELILNKSDTANILSAVELVRSIQGSLQSSLYAMTAEMLFNKIAQSSLGKAAKDTIEQIVHITAEFPNVEDKNEIQEAFNELVNLAAQRAF